MYGRLQVVFMDSTLDRFTAIEQILQLYLLSIIAHHINKILIIVPCIFVYCYCYNFGREKSWSKFKYCVKRQRANRLKSLKQNTPADVI